MQYPCLDRGPAEDILVLRETGQHVTDVKIIWKGTGEPFLEASAPSLFDRLQEIRAESDGQSDRGWGHKFDAAGAATVHRWTRELQLPARVIADQGFWRWLAVVYGYDIVRWRYDDGKGLPLKRENFGLKGTRENLFFRMYQIGSIVYEPKQSDPYALATVGGADFWRSHILRQNYANAHPVARTMVRLQAGMIDGEPALETLEIRELAKDLRRLRANIVFECLRDDGAKKLILERLPLVRERARQIAEQKSNAKKDSNGADLAGVPAGTR